MANKGLIKERAESRALNGEKGFKIGSQSEELLALRAPATGQNLAAFADVHDEGYRPYRGELVLSTQENAAIVRRFAEEVITQGDLESAGQFVWEDVVEQVPLPGQGPGVEGLKDILRTMRSAFPDLDFSVQEQIAEGDKVASRFEWTGTHRGEFLGVPATGHPVRVWGIVIDRFEEGRIKDTRIIMDTLGLMRQLGVFPPPRV